VKIWCAHWDVRDEVDADGQRLCLNCGAVLGPPPDVAADLAIAYLAVVRDAGSYGGPNAYEPTEEQEAFAAQLANGKP
jgi:hypothetical protein